MPRRVSSLVALVGAAAVAALPSAAAGARGRRFRSGALHEVRVPHPDAGRREALHRPSTCPKDAGAEPALPDPADPHALRRRALRRATPTRTSVGPSEARGEGGVHLRLPGRAGPLHVRGRVRGRAAVQPGQGAEGRGRVERHLRHDRLAAEEACRWNNGKVGVWGISYPGFYAAMAAIDAHPALVAVSPQAPIADWFVGDDFHHNGAFFLPHAFNFYTSFGKPRPEPTTKWRAALRPRHRRRLRVLPAGGAHAEPRPQVPQGRGGLLEGGHGARDATTPSGRPATCGRT